MCAWMFELGSRVYLGNLGLNVFVRIVASSVWFGFKVVGCVCFCLIVARLIKSTLTYTRSGGVTVRFCAVIRCLPYS